MKDIVTIKMPKEQQLWLLRRLKVDWDEEVNYQWSNGEHDTEYLEEMLKCYAALLGVELSIIDVVVNNEIIRNMQQDIDELKGVKHE